jgi:hypothetical protein
MRWLLLVALLGCKSESEPRPSSERAVAPEVKAEGKAEGKSDGKLATKPPDEMDEKMRHCPVAIDGAQSTMQDIDGGVRFSIKAPEAAVDEARRRAHHIVDFAARKTREGHGGFDGKGGGRMRNCPVVTDNVTITATDIDGGARVDVVTTAERVEALRAETRERAEKFPFTGATITITIAKP